jgi:hypothetical protein
MTPFLVFLLKIPFSIQGPFGFYINVRIIFSTSVKNVNGI